MDDGGWKGNVFAEYFKKYNESGNWRRPGAIEGLTVFDEQSTPTELGILAGGISEGRYYDGALIYSLLRHCRIRSGPAATHNKAPLIIVRPSKH